MSEPEIERRYYENGNVEFEYYFINGTYHREDGPAYIWYYKNGNVESEYYILNGKRHREDGPAVIWYYENGNVDYERYYINGERLTREEWYSKLCTKQKVNLLYGIDNE
jgi:antitoxin component YwqK of YwqJK toxin-antitoxin module